MTQQINLFNPIFRKQKKYFSSVTMLQALGLIGLACALLAGDAARRTAALQSQAAAGDRQLAASQQRLEAFKAQFTPRQKSTTLAAELAAAQEELAMLSEASATVARGGFGDTHGFSPYFRAFARQRLDGLWLTRLDIGAGGTRLGVQGNAMQADLVPKYMKRLSSEPVMQGKSFASLDIGQPAAVELAPGTPPVTPSYLAFNLQSAGGASLPAGAK